MRLVGLYLASGYHIDCHRRRWCCLVKAMWHRDGIGMVGGYRTDCHRLRWSTSGHGCHLCPVATSWHGAIVPNVAAL
jgi:hypothetical protein